MVSEILRESYEILKAYYGYNPPKIKSIVRGYHFIGIQLTDMSAGIAYAERDWIHEFPLFLKKDDKDLPDIYSLAKKGYEGQGMEVCYGLALMNALTAGMLINSDKYEIIEDSDVIELWKDLFKPSDIIGIVGNMTPVIEPLIPLCSKIILLDKHAGEPGKNPIPDGVELVETIDGIAKVDVLIATGSSLIYHSTEELIEKTPKARLKSVIGPSVTLPPEPFWRRGVQYVGGSIVDERLFQGLLSENINDTWETFMEKRKNSAMHFGKDTGIRKIGLMKL